MLDSLSGILNFLVETIDKKHTLQENLALLLKNLDKPIILSAASDVNTYFEMIKNYIGFLGSYYQDIDFIKINLLEF